MDIVLFRYCEEKQPKPEDFGVLDKILALDFPGLKVHEANNIDHFTRVIRSIPHSAILFDWDTYRAPTEVIDLYYQSLYCRSLMVIFYSHVSRAAKEYFKEFGIVELAEVRERNAPAAYASVVSQLKSVLKMEDVEVKKRRARLAFHYYLHNGRVDKAEEIFAKITPILPVEEKVFCEALILKAKREFEASLIRLRSTHIQTPKIDSLAGTNLYHMGDYAASSKSLEKAHQVSPLNLHRNLMIARCLEHLADDNRSPVSRKDAMAAYVDLFKKTPTFGGVNGKIIKLVLQMESVESLPLISNMLINIPHKEVMRIFKRIPDLSEPFKTAFTDVFVTAMSKAANAMIQKDDIQALKYYKTISKLVPESDTNRHMILDYCLARAYFRFGQLEQAREICSKVQMQSGGKYDKAIALRKLIDKAIKGEFDVLVDDEKDWLITRRAR